MELTFSGEIIHWRGPAPYHFIAVPDAQCGPIEAASSELSYGWGCIPASGRIGSTTFTTSLFPKDGGYLPPLKVAVRRREGVALGDVVTVRLAIDV